MRMWGSVAWWLVVVFSVPFALYALPFIYGEFEIYKHVSINAAKGRYDLAGLHVHNNLRTWQAHASAALVYLAIGPLQFSTSFRDKYPVIHKRLGYAFALCTITTAVTGATVMRKASELPSQATFVLGLMAPATLIALAMSITAARKDFESHRRWMIRSATIGYSVMWMRLLSEVMFRYSRLSKDEALDLGVLLSLALDLVLVEIYVQMYLNKSGRKRTFSQNSANMLLDRRTKKVS